MTWDEDAIVEWWDLHMRAAMTSRAYERPQAEALEGAQLSRLFWQAVARLPERDMRVILMRVGAGLTFSQVAERIGVSKARAREISLRAVRAIDRELRAALQAEAEAEAERESRTPSPWWQRHRTSGPRDLRWQTVYEPYLRRADARTIHALASLPWDSPAKLRGAIDKLLIEERGFC